MTNHRAFAKLDAAIDDLHDKSLAIGKRLGLLEAHRIATKNGAHDIAAHIMAEYLCRVEALREGEG
ncbi:hypothetical protein [Sphingomonas sp.]|uniref:hypothetical protein n=1 Tax=Sphingomonas sp. TaxID=28214 RepID=UPI002FD9B049